MRNILILLEKTLLSNLLSMMEFFLEGIEQIFTTNNGLMQGLHVLVMEYLEMFVVFSLEKICLMNLGWE